MLEQVVIKITQYKSDFFFNGHTCDCYAEGLPSGDEVGVCVVILGLQQLESLAIVRALDSWLLSFCGFSLVVHAES